MSSIAVTLVLALWLPLHAQAQSEFLVPANESVSGRTQAEWSGLWWQWAGSFARESSPVSDQTGELCNRNQSGSVWFLAGTYGTRRTIRRCTVPRDAHIFLPLINAFVVRGLTSTTSCFGLMSEAAKMMEGARSLIFEIDGFRYPEPSAHRQPSNGCFDLSARSGHPPYIQAAADGYYIMLRPLSPGVHTINFGGALPGMAQAVTYTLQVE